MKLNPLSKQLGVELGVSDPLILDFILESFLSQYKHKLHKGYFSRTFKSLNEAFQRDKFEEINASLGLYDVKSYSKHSCTTRGLKHTAKLIEAMNKAIDKTLSNYDDAVIIDGNYSKVGAVACKIDGVTKTKFKSKILQAVRVNTKSLRELTTITATTDREKLARIQAGILLFLSLDDSVLPLGWIPQRYKQCGTGRLYGIAKSLQNCCKEVRESALNGCYGYDISNCHYAILAQLTNVETTTMDDYLKRKPEVRIQLSKELDLTIKEIKTILISLIFGASLGAYKPGKAISDIAKTEAKYKTVVSNNIIKSLHAEISTSAKEIIKDSLIKGGRYSGKVKNAVGLVCSSREKAKQLSHILQGYEVKALEAIVSIIGVDTAVLLHDGIGAYSEHDLHELEQAIRVQTGLDLTLESESIEPLFCHSSKTSTGYENKGSQRFEKEKCVS